MNRDHGPLEDLERSLRLLERGAGQELVLGHDGGKPRDAVEHRAEHVRQVAALVFGKDQMGRRELIGEAARPGPCEAWQVLRADRVEPGGQPDAGIVVHTVSLRFRARIERPATFVAGRSRGLTSLAAEVPIEVGLLGLLLGLVTEARAGACADRAADDRTGRPTDGAADGSPGERARPGTGARAGLVVAFDVLTGDGPADGANDATDHGARRPTDGATDRGTTECPGTRSCGLHAALVLVVLEVAVAVEVPIEPFAVDPIMASHACAST